MSANANDIPWLAPWGPIIGGEPDDSTAKELYSELCESHPLFGIPARPIGCRQDCDDFLFELLDGTKRLARVHLTFAQHPEPDPRWPQTSIFTERDQFLQTMRADAEDWDA